MNFLVIWIFIMTAVLAEDQVVQEFIRANNLFTSAVYKEILKSNPENFLVTPLSAETILAFAQSGCKGETAEEIRNALHLPNNEERIESGIKTFHLHLKGSEDYIFHSANKMYVKENFSIREEFRKVATEVYHSELENIDFSKKVVAAETMNKWVEKQTNDKIHNLINWNDIKNDTKLVLIDGLYFKAHWTIPFIVHSTKKAKFYKTTQDVLEVDMMYHSYVHRDHFNYYECPHLKAKLLELPFKGGDASMTIILPNETEGLVALENQLERVFTPHNFTQQLVNLVLPKFKIESKIDFVEVLQNLGVSKVFNENEADLSGIAGEKGDLIIDKIVQKTFIDVNEAGVEATAATYILVPGTPSAIPTPKVFTADHPFIFYIKIKGAIAFAGRVTEPHTE